MTRIRPRILPSTSLLALAGLALGACDGGTEPRGIGDFNAAEVSAAVQTILEPIDVALEPNFILSTFVNDVLVATDPAHVAGLDRVRPIDPTSVVAEPVRAIAAALLSSRTADIPAELHGSTFYWDVTAESWMEDPELTGAPADGIRIIWYTLNDFGEFVVPLEEVGYIDVVEDDTPTLDRLAVQIVRTDGEAEVTVADYIFGQGPSEAGDDWTDQVELSGTFGDGVAATDVDISGQAAGSFATGDEDYSLDMLVDGPDGSYRWILQGSLDGASDTYSDDYLITVVAHEAGAASTTTILDLDTTADATGSMSGSGTLSHSGDTVANIDISDSEFSYSPPGGGSFSPSQLASLDELTFYMFFSGPLLLLVLPFVSF